MELSVEDEAAVKSAQLETLRELECLGSSHSQMLPAEGTCSVDLPVDVLDSSTYLYAVVFVCMPPQSSR